MRKHGAVRTVEIFFVAGCPNYERVADAVRDLARESGVAVDVTKVEVHDAATARNAATTVLGAGALLLPVGTCPACYPAYAAALSSLGLGFLLYERYLLPLTALALGISLAGLGWRAGVRRGYGPLLLGLAASAAALFGKFAIGSDAIHYLGLATLVAASVCDAWPARHASSRSCARCAPRARSRTTGRTGR